MAMVRAMLAAAVLGMVAIVGCAGPETGRLTPGQRCILVPPYPPGDPDYSGSEVTLTTRHDPLDVEGVPVGASAVVVRDDGAADIPFRPVLVRVESEAFTGAGEVPRVALRPVK